MKLASKVAGVPLARAAIPRRQAWLVGIFDAILLTVAFFVGYFMRYADINNFWPEVFRLLPHAFLYVTFTIGAMAAVGVYAEIGDQDWKEFLVRVLVAFALSLILVAVTGFLVRAVLISRTSLGIAYPLALALLFVNHQLWNGLSRAGSLARRIFVIGDPPMVERLMALSRDGGARVFEVVGLRALDDILAYDRGNPDVVVAAIRASGASELVIAARERRRRLPLRILLRCRALGIQVTDYETFFERETGRVDLDTIRPGWFVFSAGFEGTRLEEGAKRTLDLLVATALILFTLPLMLVTALAIWLEDGAPVLHRQVRVGRGGRPFLLYKFRSMRKDAERAGPRHATPANDPRITRVGRFIRRRRIDELPQLFNVLKGDMSLVGPRPDVPELRDYLADKLPYHEQRYRVKPGLCGWAQLNAPYPEDLESAKLKLEYDLYYLKHWSLLFDLVILLQTVRVVIWDNGAR